MSGFVPLRLTPTVRRMTERSLGQLLAFHGLRLVHQRGRIGVVPFAR